MSVQVIIRFFSFNLEFARVSFSKNWNCTSRKNSRGGSAGRSFLKPFFLTNFSHYFTPYHWFRKFLIVHQPVIIQNTMRNLYWAGDTLFALVLHLNCTALSQSESSNFFHVYYSHNNLHLVRKYARIFVLGHNLLLITHGFPRALLSENCSVLGSGN